MSETSKRREWADLTPIERLGIVIAVLEGLVTAVEAMDVYEISGEAILELGRGVEGARAAVFRELRRRWAEQAGADVADDDAWERALTEAREVVRIAQRHYETRTMEELMAYYRKQRLLRGDVYVAGR